jgi:hypothetical protein
LNVGAGLKPAHLQRDAADLPRVAAKYAARHFWTGFKPAPTKSRKSFNSENHNSDNHTINPGGPQWHTYTK